MAGNSYGPIADRIRRKQESASRIQDFLSAGQHALDAGATKVNPVSLKGLKSSVKAKGHAGHSSGGDAGGMSPAFSKALNRMIAASGGKITVSSGYRSEQRQQELWEQALKKYGDPEIADNWVARPGTSNHGKGIAADLKFADDSVKQWAHKNARKFGLHFPMGHEPWHIEPVR